MVGVVAVRARTDERLQDQRVHGRVLHVEAAAGVYPAVSVRAPPAARRRPRRGPTGQEARQDPAGTERRDTATGGPHERVVRVLLPDLGAEAGDEGDSIGPVQLWCGHEGTLLREAVTCV